MLSIFRNLQPHTYIILLVVLIITRIVLLVFTESPILIFDLETLGMMSLIFAQALWINYIFNNAEFISEKTLVPALIWILLTLINPSYLELSWIHLLTMLVIAMLQLLYPMSGSHISPQQCFQIGILSGVAFLIHPPFIVLSFTMLFVIYNKNPLSIRSYVIYLIGVLMTVFWGWSLLYLIDIDLNWLSRFYDSIGFVLPTLNQYESINWAVLGVFFIAGLFGIKTIVTIASAKRKRDVRTLMFFALALGLVFLFSKSTDLTYVVFVFIPFSFMISVALLIIRKKKLAELVFGMFVITILSSIVLGELNVV